MTLKFIFDRLMAMIGLLVLWPVLLILLILIRIKMPDGPAIFKQKRVGRDGRIFTMYKFRSMTVGHEGNSVSVAGESRITPFGATLRRYKLDELPELWNVLIGDMSFVGPRHHDGGLVLMFRVMPTSSAVTTAKCLGFARA